MIKLRKAGISDVKKMHQLINYHAKREKMLPRSLNEIYETLRDHVICEEDGEITGVCALHILWEDLAEVRSLAVRKTAQRQGVGSSLIKRCVTEAKKIGVRKVFVLTYSPEIFRSLGFADIDKSELPHKVWGDCLKCHKFPDCDEFALIRVL